MKKPSEVVEVEKGKIHIVVELIEYIPNAVVSKTIIKKVLHLMQVKS